MDLRYDMLSATKKAWVPVDDKKPETGKEVLTYGEYGYEVAFIDEDGKWNAKSTDYETGEPWLRDKGIVTHWMYLPLPPD